MSEAIAGRQEVTCEVCGRSWDGVADRGRYLITWVKVGTPSEEGVAHCQGCDPQRVERV